MHAWKEKWPRELHRPAEKVNKTPRNTSSLPSQRRDVFHKVFSSQMHVVNSKVATDGLSSNRVTIATTRIVWCINRDEIRFKKTDDNTERRRGTEDDTTIQTDSVQS